MGEEANTMGFCMRRKVLGDTGAAKYQVLHGTGRSQQIMWTTMSRVHLYPTYCLGPEALWGEIGPCCLDPRWRWRNSARRCLMLIVISELRRQTNMQLGWSTALGEGQEKTLEVATPFALLPMNCQGDPSPPPLLHQAPPRNVPIQTRFPETSGEEVRGGTEKNLPLREVGFCSPVP